MNIQVTVSGAGAANGVQLVKNGTALATLSAPPYAFSWDTTKEAEGSYQIVAQMVLSGQIVASAPVTIVVDRTAGSLSNYVPVLNAAADNIRPDDAPQLAIDDLGEPVIVWAGRSAGAAQINVAHWTGATWDQSFGALSPAQGKAAIVLAQGSIPIVAWEDNTTASLTTHVAKSNH